MECSNCGSVYEVTRHKLIMRDRDSINCEVCGEELHSWNGAVMYSAKLVKRGTLPASSAAVTLPPTP